MTIYVPDFSAHFAVVGIPKAQPRARAFARKLGNGKFAARMYDAGTAESWKALVAAAAAPQAPEKPLQGPIYVSLLFVMPRPKSRYRKKDPECMLWCTSKPDCDNLAKAVLDCLTQMGWWNDDAQVVDLHIKKQWHAKDASPSMLVSVMSLFYEAHASITDYLRTTAAAAVSPPAPASCEPEKPRARSQGASRSQVSRGERQYEDPKESSH